MESNYKWNIRLCRLSEVQDEGWDAVSFLGPGPDDDEDNSEWEKFRGLLLGVSSFLDRIYWVRQAPCCATGSILTLGPDIAGPGGTGEQTIEPSLVLASTFDEWLVHLKRYGWVEYGLGPGAIWDLSDAEQSELRSYYRSLNPGIRWEPE